MNESRYARQLAIFSEVYTTGNYFPYYRFFKNYNTHNHNNTNNKLQLITDFGPTSFS